MKRICLIVLATFLIFCRSALAYRDDYPPYSFKEGAYSQIQSKLLTGNTKGEFRSDDGEKITVSLKWANEDSHFLLKKDGKVLMKAKDQAEFFPESVYQVNLDKNGFNDFIVFSGVPYGSGLGSHFGCVDIFLKSKRGKYRHVHYKSFDGGIEDFVDMNKDGRPEIILMSFYEAKKGNYFCYSIYEIKKWKLINADSKYKGFPKFIRYTNKKNDKNATQLTAKEKALHIKEVESKISYGST